jgi:DNA modification methylase
MKSYEIHNLDCMDLKIDPVSLIYLDPPYSCKSEDEYYGVGDTFDEFLTEMKRSLRSIEQLLSKDGNILVHMDQKAIHYIKIIMDDIFGRENFRNEIIWCFSNPASATRWLPRKHNTILWYGRGNYIFNQPRIPYKTKMNVGGKAAWSKEKIPWEHYRDQGKPLEDWWIDVPALCRNEPEKTGYKTQKPLDLMKRIVETWSNKGDRVLDPFMGSGSFVEAAYRLGRYAIGGDISPDAVKIATERMEAIPRGVFDEF